MSIELKPCPFCGATAEVRYHPSCMRDPSCRSWEVGCSICDARVGSTIYAIGKTRDEAIAAWNTRAERTCKPANVAEYAWDDFECSECGWVTWSFLMEHEGCGTVCQPRYCPNCGAKVVE